MRTFFSSDLHFFHHNILSYTDRDKVWNNVDEMNEGIVNNWNKVVAPEDRVYIIGDVSLGGKSKAPRLAAILGRLNGSRTSRVSAGLSDESKIFLIPGNHDTFILKDEACMKEINLLPPLYELQVPHLEGGRKRKLTIVMCHFPLLTWNKAGKVLISGEGIEYPSSICLFGHSHTSKKNLNTGTTRLDVGMDGHDCIPWSLEEVWDYLKEKEYQQVDHHGKDTNHS